MKNFNILIIFLICLAAYFSIIFVVNGGIENPEYQTAIVVAIATISSQIMILFIKPLFESKATKNSKTFGVVYDKKFLVYNEIVSLIIDARSYFVYFVNEKDLTMHKNVYNKIEDIKRLILKNRIIISNDVFKYTNELYGDMRANFDNYVATFYNVEMFEADYDIIKDFITGEKVDHQIFEILDITRKELNVI